MVVGNDLQISRYLLEQIAFQSCDIPKVARGGREIKYQKSDPFQFYKSDQTRIGLFNVKKYQSASL